MIRVRRAVQRIPAYVPGRPVDEVCVEYGIDRAIKLASNESPIGPSPKALDALKQSVAGVHVYPDMHMRDLRDALATHLGLQADQICPGAGSDELIRLIGDVMLEPGDEVVLARPSFAQYRHVARLREAELVEIPLAADTHDLQAMADATGPRTRLIFVCNPNNPTGTAVGNDAVRRFLDNVPDHVVTIFDEAYADYAEMEDFPPTLAWVGEGRPVVVLRTFSKIYGLAGLRIGYAAGPQSLIEALLRVRDPFSVSVPAQAAAVAALTDVAHVRRAQAMNREGKRQLTEGLKAIGLHVTPSEANFIWVDLKRPSRPVFESLLQSGVIVRCGEDLGAPSHLRVSIGTPEDNTRFLEALADLLADVQSIGGMHA